MEARGQGRTPLRRGSPPHRLRVHPGPAPGPRRRQGHRRGVPRARVPESFPRTRPPECNWAIRQAASADIGGWFEPADFTHPMGVADRRNKRNMGRYVRSGSRQTAVGRTSVTGFRYFSSYCPTQQEKRETVHANRPICVLGDQTAPRRAPQLARRAARSPPLLRRRRSRPAKRGRWCGPRRPACTRRRSHAPERTRAPSASPPTQRALVAIASHAGRALGPRRPGL